MLDRSDENILRPSSGDESVVSKTPRRRQFEPSKSLRDRPFIRSPWIYFLVVTLFDSLIGAFCVLGAVRWRYDFLNLKIPNDIEHVAAYITFGLCVIIWAVLRLPRAIWRYTSLDDVSKLLMGVVFVMLMLPLCMYLFVNSGAGFPRATPIIAGPLFFLIIVASRLAVVVLRNGDIRAVFNKSRPGRRNAILAGSTRHLHNTLRDMDRSSTGANSNIVGLITTDSTQTGRSIRGIPIIGTLANLREAYGGVASKFSELPQLIAVDPNPDKSRASALVREAAAIGAPLSRLALGVQGQLTPFEAQDLIGRRPKALNTEPLRRLLEGKNILITGAGGSIGSELVRQVVGLQPAKLALVDHAEFNLYRIDRELNDMASLTTDWSAYLGNVCDIQRMTEIFDEVRPHVVLHAAALKHVPLGEANPLETLHTNVEGTRVLLDLCVSNNVRSFTLVSTDKAVNLTNVMGASKGIAELLTHAYNRDNPDLYACAVRFGNVLASAGSVIPLFEEQIARGGPVTVTDPDAIRYFMTTQEASALVLQATALNATQRKSDSSIYVLEMGEPVNIARLARQLIHLRGKVPDRDIEIIYTGLRPGEALEERLTTDPETLETTYVDGLLRIQSSGDGPKKTLEHIDKLLIAVEARNLAKIRSQLSHLLPEYEPNGSLH